VMTLADAATVGAISITANGKQSSIGSTWTV
jgi:hypothetical protein